MEKLQISYADAVRSDPDYCGYCKCSPCQCDGFGNFEVEEEVEEEEGRGQPHVESAEYLQHSASRHAARMARGPREQ